ncbi:MAG: hypothetical protein HY348_11330 [Nitrospira defluvii]|nr:hypothetical protein [Nitrospira defluvii]
MGKAWNYLESRGDALLAELRDLSFEALLALHQPEEELRFGCLWKGRIGTHVDLIDQQTIRVVVHGVLELRLLGNYHNYVEGFRRGRYGSFEKLTEADYYEFD